MSLKRTLTAVAVDSVHDYLRERLHAIKQLDLDKDGQKDVDQLIELLNSLAAKFKDCMESTDFQKLAVGLDEIVSGVSAIASSVDRQKLKAASAEFTAGLKQLAKLLQIGIQQAKRPDGSSK